ncbi:hypothetical protein GPECTOR_6g699 [Gonium pectorale]|uniref:Uncharacterized protein n=1 Tax=Gonium pectorale TaxID=33097 RepID=A0A150GVB9_GONPE|nr:hypothetical protein GPECTOR_6g699 [Gonium pectorale]|eukprot:KXZ53781.1 hypothetical protein GPECTOR_6g699 [Gonium pectorale]
MPPDQRSRMVDQAAAQATPRSGSGPAPVTGAGRRGPDDRGHKDVVADRAAAATAGPAAGRLVDPQEVRSEGADLPPGHDASGSTLKSTADQSGA